MIESYRSKGSTDERKEDGIQVPTSRRVGKEGGWLSISFKHPD